MPKATWNGAVLAESNETERVEGNYYFPPESLNKDYFKKAASTTVCPWKGTANYFDIEVNGETNAGAAWAYHEPKDAAKNIKDHVAFWRGVEIED